MNPQQLRLMAQAAVRRRLSAAVGMSGLGGLGSVDSDLQRLDALLYAVQAFQSELLHSTSTLPKSEIKDNAQAYANVMNRLMSPQKLGSPSFRVQVKAGGDAAKRVMNSVKGAEQTLAETKRMWEADLNDPSGAASKLVAKQIDEQANVELTQAGEKLDFWIKATDVKNPFSPLSIVSTIKKYAIWGLVIGGVVLAAPTLFPAIGKLIGGARRPSPAPAPPPQPVTANRRRR